MKAKTAKRGSRNSDADFQTQTNKAAKNTIGWMADYLEALDHADECDRVTCRRIRDKEYIHDADKARERIQKTPLSIQVRSGWYSLNASDEEKKPEEFEILLGTGGPATRIVGTLDEYGQPTEAHYEYQDWFKPWTRADNLTTEQRATVLRFAQQFYFGE